MKSLAAMLVLFVGTALAEEDLAALVRDLGSEDFAAREAATLRLAEIGEPARELLEQARSSVDAEVQMRASKILAMLDARRRIDEEYEAARKAFAGTTAEDAARRVWLDALYAAAIGDEHRIAELFVHGKAPVRFWDSARHCSLSMLVDLTWVEVIPARRLGWLGEPLGPDDVLVLAATPEDVPAPEAVPESYVREPRGLFLRRVGEAWKIEAVASISAEPFIPYGEEAKSEAERKEWAAGLATISVLTGKRDGVSCYGLAQALDAVGDFEAAIRAFERCQSTGQWPDYCIVHRYFDLMRLGRRAEAVRALAEEPGPGSCEYLRKVITWLRHDLTTEKLLEYAQGQGSYEAESVHYYLGMERLIAGDLDAAREHLTLCATEASGCYEQTFAADALWLLERPEEAETPSGDAH